MEINEKVNGAALLIAMYYINEFDYKIGIEAITKQQKMATVCNEKLHKKRLRDEKAQVTKR